MKGKRVLLVNPWIYDFAAYDLWAKPLGLLQLGAILRENGCEVWFADCLRTPGGLKGKNLPRTYSTGHGKFFRQIVDKPESLRDFPRSYARYGISREAFLEELVRLGRPDAVLVTSFMTYWYPGVFEAIRCVREAFGRVPVLLGGIYATLCRDHALRHSGADMVIGGEGELKVLHALCGLWGTSPGYTPDPCDPDSLPYPLFDLVDPLRYVCIQTSRGCPFRCAYCVSHLLNPAMHRRDPIRVADEIEYWSSSRGVMDFALYDDAFLFQSEKLALPLMREVMARGLNVRFHCPNALHARYLSREAARAMKASGFTTIRLGLETADEEIQRRTGGKVTRREFLEALEHLLSAGFDLSDVGVYILCGLPGQRAEQVMEDEEFVRGTGARPVIAEYSPLPGTALWEDACRVSRYPLADDPIFHNNTLLPCAWEGLDFSMYREIRHAARGRTQP
ncbi:MAG: radical SAM protein [Desulfomonilia bacterium]|jgi:radical SAM superfamily enzyme YgiQ (UPF0313 family)